ncbi:MAG TPA: flagellin [Devosiaceae bacterium]|nr:flagellin [Devosiaceae bacterium]
MSDIVLSASVRQNLLALQSTTQLLATTQNDLATGNKVNSALDNPTSYFTAQNLNTRASDISNLLDSVSNGVQVLQAANTGITSLQSLLSSAKSIANQALEATSGYDTKSQVVSTAITGATADNLLGTVSYTGLSVTGSAIQNNTTGAAYNNTVSGAEVYNNSIPGTYQASAETVTDAASITGTTNLSGPLSTSGFAAGQSFSVTVGGVSKTFDVYDSGAGGTAPTNGDVGVDLNGTTGTGADLATAIQGAFGTSISATINGGNNLQITSTNLSDSITINSGTTGAGTLGFTGASVTAAPTVTATPIATATDLNGTSGTGLAGLAAGNSFTVNGKTISFVSTGTSTVNAVTGGTIGLDQTVGDVVNAINTVAGGTVASINGSGQLVINANNAPAGVASINLSNSSGSPLAALGISGSSISVANTGGATSSTDITATTLLSSTGSATSNGLGTAITAGSSLTVNGATINFAASGTGGTDFNSATNTYTVDLDSATVGDVLNTIDKITGTYGTSNASSVSGGKIQLSTGAAALTIAGTGNALSSLGLTANTYQPNNGAPALMSGATKLSQAAGPTSNGLTSPITDGQTLTVDGKTITFSSTAATSTDANGGTINLGTGSVQDVLDAIDKVTGTFGTANASTVNSSGEIVLNTGTTSDLSLGGSALSALGLSPATTARQANSSLDGLTLKIGATDGGTATNITFGTGAGQVSSLDELNTALAANNLEASLDSTTGALTITTTNDHAAATLGAISGTATTYAGSPLFNATVAAPVADTDAQNTRANLVTQFNNVMDQIKTTAQDASYNGVNLLNGDQLKLVFNETGTSTLNIQGVTDNPSGLGLSYLTSGSDFLDNSQTNQILDVINTASSTLQSQASELGSNLSIVQIRQDFSQNMINVLQTGASNLTLADPNTLAADSQALSTRQSIAVSALALANSSQQSVLRLLQ